MESGDVASIDAKDAVPDIPRPGHQYRFKKGSKIAGRYRVIGPLGFGGFSEVYHCELLSLRRSVAVKVLFEKGLGLEEARTAARLRHPNIIEVYDVLELEDGTPFIVFDYVAGETLQEALNKTPNRRLPLDEHTLRIVHQLAEAISFAHEHRVIHRDIKPSNIILDHQGKAYLTDFGLAEVKRPPEKESALTTELQQRLSGTIPYMSPEQLREGKPGDERSDLYSFGVVVYEMLTSQLPYQGQDASLIIRIVTEDPLAPTVANPDLPRRVEQMLLRVLDKDPDKRPSSCLAFAMELEEAAQAYVTASDQYAQARKLYEAKRWREALAAFEELEEQAPDFKDTARYLEQARHQARLLELYEKAHIALKQGKYQDALDTLNVLTQLAPDYDVEDVRQGALEGLAREEKRSLDEQYRQAVEQFQKGEYQACLDTLAVIRQRRPRYPDPDGIEGPAREHVERQQHLRDLYNRGVEQMGQEQWEKAIAIFQALQQAAPHYEDVETRLAMAGHMARMSSLLREARTHLQKEAFGACVDKLGELQRIDADYKRDEVIRLRQEALNRLHERARQLLQEGRFEESLAVLAELKQRFSDYSDVGELEAQNREGMRGRDLRAELDRLYAQAVEHVNRRAYAEAFKLWREIQRRKDGLDYPDPREVASRAREGLCMNLYNQALGALTQKDPRRALELWGQVRDVDPDYADSLQVEGRALAMIERAGTIRRWGIRAGAGAIALLLVAVLTAVVARGCGPTPIVTETRTPSPTPTASVPVVVSTATPTRAPSLTPTASVPAVVSTATPTRTPSPTATFATPSATPTPGMTPSPTPTPVTPSPTTTPSPSPTPPPTTGTLATALQGASIFAAPDSDSRVLGGIRAGEQVPVLGRSAYGQWFYIRNDRGVEGFVYAPRFEWPGDYESLPVKSPIGPLPTAVPTRPVQPLEMDLWALDGTDKCSGGIWYKSVFIQGRGGNGVYTYYWKGERIAGPTSEPYTFEVYSTGGAIIARGRVESGDGQVVERDLFVEAHCP